MLRALRLAHARPPDYESAFLERYRALYARALRLTRTREQAEDLVQDAFVQFTLAPTPLEDIHDIDAYLHAMLQHMHTSLVRRAARAREQSLELLDYDSAALALKGGDPAGFLQACGELTAICEFACRRCRSSKAGSVLLLRYFHGYYPREIALVLNGPARLVDGLLHQARAEVRARAEAGAAEAASSSACWRARGVAAGEGRRPRQDFLADLRRRTFAHRHATCLAADELTRLYEPGAAALACDALADIVTCPRCLDTVNARFGLPLLADRDPVDTIGPDHRPGPPDGTGRGGEARAAGLRRGAADVFEHRPRELSVAVNGFVVASHTVAAADSEQTVSVSIGEPIGFVEVFSEQGVRLLFHAVESAPAGVVTQERSVSLSDGRTLSSALAFAGAWPSVRVAYHDPGFSDGRVPAAAGAKVQADRGTECPDGERLRRPPSVHDALAARRRGFAGAREEPPTPTETRTPRPPDGAAWWARPARLASSLRHLAQPGRIPALGWLLRPQALTATAVLAVLAAWALYSFLAPPRLSARELLDRAAAAEARTTGAAGAVVHRVIELEERQADGRSVRAESRVEVWRQASTRSVARRMYDPATGTLRAIEIERPGGPARLYRPGLVPRDLAEPDKDPKAVVAAGDWWRLEPSARVFLQLTAALPPPGVEPSPSRYVVACHSGDARAEGLVDAVLTLARPSLAALEMVFTIRRGGALREYRLTERLSEGLPAAPDSNRYFEPEPGLAPAPPAGPAPSDARSSTGMQLTPEAIAGLKVEVLYLLDRAVATLGEQVSVTAAGPGVRVDAVVETAARKQELLAALAPLRANPALAVSVRSVEDVPPAPTRHGAPIVVQDVAPSQDRVAAYSDVRRYLAAHAEASWPGEPAARDARVDQDVLRFGSTALEVSGRALQRAWAMSRLLAAVPEEMADRLDAERRGRWREMIREHARNFAGETATLRALLEPVFPPAGGAADRPLVTRPETPPAGRPLAGGTASAVAELLSLASARDEAVRAAFALRAGGGAPPMVVGSAAFWEGVVRSEILAESLTHVE